MDQEKAMNNENLPAKGVEFYLSDDATEVHACLKDATEALDKKRIVYLLSEIDIKDGIRYDAIHQMIQEKRVGQLYLVAECKKPVNGKDGWYEFLFDTDVDTKPKILKDGSVDYSAYGNVPSVEEGDKLVIYHPATPSEDGVNFHGETIVAVKGKELAKLKGKGFYVSDDGKEYFAKMPGRASYENGRLVITNELLIEGDASLATGDVEFINDIHVRGNVLTGVKLISIKGSIIVDGYVEACELKAAKEVVLKNGMQGNNKGKIEAGGSVSGKFFEQVVLVSGGDVSANAIMNSDVTAKQDVTVSGKFGIIIGGTIRAERIISATIIGNMSEVKTNIFAGVAENLLALLNKLEQEEAVLEADMKKITDGIAKVDAILEKGIRQDLNTQKVKLIRAKITKENQISEKMKEKQEIVDRMARANQSKVTVLKSLYPGTSIDINGVKTYISDVAESVELMSKGAAIQMFSLL
ncbi:MAG: DUF342 domain-containing protein [Lachnospiraceae bacterium]|nr:DUF342 domain-containing protein [Lachnospiraceae bacterium]